MILMKTFIILVSLLFICGCQPSSDITEPPANSTPVPKLEKVDYAKKYADAIPFKEFMKSYEADHESFNGKKVRVIGDISQRKMQELEDANDVLEKRIYFDSNEVSENVGCIVAKDFTSEEIGEQLQERVFEGEVFESVAGIVHLKPCKLLE